MPSEGAPNQKGPQSSCCFSLRTFDGRKAIRNRERFGGGNNSKMNFNSSENKKITRTETTLSVVDELKKNSN